jgi:hypothetical protein
VISQTMHLAAFLVVSGLCLAQRGSFDDERFSSRRERSYAAPEISYDRNGVPTWDRDPLYPGDVFTYVRMLYDAGGYSGRYGRGGKWATDWPDSDLNFSFRLQQLTALKVNPDPIILEASDPRLVDYPWLYIIEPGGGRWERGGMNLTPEEAEALRRYAFNGGFILVDDFWGEDEWDNFYVDFKKIFPDREPVDLELDHEIFHNVYDLKVKPQVPSIGHWRSGMRYETYDSAEVHYRAVHDDLGRIMMLICHNTDLGDGWEREGEDPGYFRDHSEPSAYPMGINILFYAMTH